ncbi:MAG: mandelate racemase/muconate lactonizing enzyme family protein, partial [Pyrinomonadaceae bacterium]
MPARPGSINSPQLSRPLHKLPVDGNPAWTVQFDVLPKCILKVELDDGSVGLGECYRGHSWTTIETVAKALLDKTLDEIPLQALPIGACREYDGFDCAIWDCFAKVHGLRVVDLLGGALRTDIKVGAWSSHRQLEEIGPLVEKIAQQG